MGNDINQDMVKARITQHLKKEAKGCDYLVLWLDCDREGENICFEVINCTKAYLKPKNHQQIFRAHFSCTNRFISES